MVNQYITAILLGAGMILLSITPEFFGVQQQNVMAQQPSAQPPADPSARPALLASPVGGAQANATGAAPCTPPANATGAAPCTSPANATGATPGTPPPANPAGRAAGPPPANPAGGVPQSGGFH
jgi:hypothetical protein